MSISWSCGQGSRLEGNSTWKRDRLRQGIKQSYHYVHMIFVNDDANGLCGITEVRRLKVQVKGSATRRSHTRGVDKKMTD